MFVRVLLCMLAASSSAYAESSRTVPEFKVNAKVERKNATLNFERGAVAGIVDDEALDGIAGTTGDFPGGQVPAYIVFDQSVSEEKLMGLANYQGRLKGLAQCKRIRLGSSPLFPHLKSAVLAEQCTLKSIKH